MDKTTLIKVENRNNGRTGYSLPELRVQRLFNVGEVKEIPFEELQQLSYANGGRYILENCLKIDNTEAIKELLGEVEPEYNYTIDDIKKVMLQGSIDEFLDCLDFAPDSVKEQIKDLAVILPLNDVKKIEAIKNKMNFDVMGAIEIQNSKFDGEDESTSEQKEKVRRAAGGQNGKPTRRVILD